LPPLEPDRGAYIRWLVATGPRRSGRRLDAAAQYLTLGLRYRSPVTVAAAGPVLLGEAAMGRLLGLLRRPGPRPAWVSSDSFAHDSGDHRRAR
jgi:hypothetical protein